MGTHIDFPEKIISLLWEGRIDEARSAIDDARNALIREKSSLEDKIRKIDEEIQSITKVLPPTAQTGNAVQIAMDESSDKAGAVDKSPSKQMTREQIEKRREVVINAAKSLGPDGGMIRVEDVARTLREQDYDLGVRSSRRNTAISSILNRSEQFERLSVGRYRYAGPQANQGFFPQED